MVNFFIELWTALLSMLGWMPKTKVNPLPPPPKASMGSGIELRGCRQGYFYRRRGYAPISGPCTPYWAIRACQRYLENGSWLVKRYLDNGA